MIMIKLAALKERRRNAVRE